MSQQVELIRWFLIREIREIYHSKTMVLSMFLTSVVTLGIYWFTAKAFAPSVESGLQNYGIDYFSYILVGDLTFLVPSLMFVGAADSIRRCAVDRSLENMLTAKIGPRRVLLLQMLALLPIEFLKACLTLAIAMLFFQFRMPVLSFAQVFLLQLISLPLFIGLGLVAAAILLRFSRGESVIGQMSSLAIIFAGAYFPLAVFPESLSWVTKIFSPFTIVLEGTRDVLNHSSTATFLPLTLTIILWGAMALTLGLWLLKWGLEHNRKKGAPFLFYR